MAFQKDSTDNYGGKLHKKKKPMHGKGHRPPWMNKDDGDEKKPFVPYGKGKLHKKSK